MANLDFETSPTLPILQRITLPPSISQRRHVNQWAVILSGLSDTERGACALASRMLRYAVYLSAGEILRRKYAGRRLESQELIFPAPIINWWPYLRARQKEWADRLDAYKSSFLARFYTELPIDGRLWASPDNEKQITIVLRFLQTRLWSALSIGSFSGRSDALDWLHTKVIDASEVIPGEIWVVCTSTGEEFYVLEATCEVIGHPPAVKPRSTTGTASLRADWSNYVAEQVSQLAAGSRRSLLSRMRWANEAEYDHGVSRHWLSKTSSSDVQDAWIHRVAERYTLACIVSNSVSGGWKSSIQMAQDAVGLVDTGPPPNRSEEKQLLNLFLPAIHHVESVHFTTNKGKPLHPAVAVIQTPAREYYVLRDNGMQIGCEEDGIVEMWCRLLGCEATGEGIADK
ncbi:hypothetical protein K488DRAFT_41059 [Vararia minispora EC-137]|uniref:Uncharacterized protein n=1 Tax=Vararia minispora EC-137 TaxID=1314806 RepID=A0ACB8QX60_9AGAM|nr:hypothetical protein K488DRAFT_41059 [Vararia minispora EC-137]